MRRSGVGSENAHFSPSSQVVLRLHIRGSHFENRTLQPFPVSSVTDHDLTKDLLSFLSPSFLSSTFSFSSPLSPLLPSFLSSQSLLFFPPVLSLSTFPLPSPFRLLPTPPLPSPPFPLYYLFISVCLLSFLCVLVVSVLDGGSSYHIQIK